MFIIAAAFVALIIVQVNVLSVTSIVGSSMEPTLKTGDVRLFNHLNKTPDRYDIVTARVDNRTVVKRVYGLPGDRLEVRDGTVYVNGEAVSGAYDFETDDAGILENGISLGADEYFLLGDNRDVSYDSRFFGPVNAEQIRATMVNPNNI